MFKIARYSSLLIPLVGISLQQAAHSQALPPAGAVAPARAPAQPVVNPSAPAAATAATAATNAPQGSLPVKGYLFEGNTLFSSEALQAAMELPPGNVSFAQLDAAVDKISRRYRAAGYLVARAYLPPQTSPDGIIKIAIVEGHYASPKVTNTTPVSDERIKATINAALCGNPASCIDPQASAPITDAAVERALRIVGDIPGVASTGELQPGSKIGTSNIAVTAKPSSLPTHTIGVDNYGSRYTGVNRVNVGADFNNLNNDAAQLSLALASTGAHQTSGNLSFNQLIGYQGLRVGVGLGRSQYLLGGDFSPTNTRGTGTALGTFATYPLLRHREHNLILKGSLDAKWMQDQIGQAADYRKQAYLYGMSMSGDVVDTAGGYNNFFLGLNGGDIKAKNADTAALYANSKSSGNYHKLAYFLSRQQAIAGPVTAYVGVSGQTSYKNLDGSEKMALGGPFGVRAYPGGEAAGDRGIVSNWEMRYTQAVLGNATLTYAGFYDRGWSQANINTWVGYNGASKRALGGYGVGIVLNQPGGFGIRLMVAKHASQGADISTAEPSSNSRAWLQMSKAF